MTSLPCCPRNFTESEIIRRFSSGVVWSASATWNGELFPKMVTTGVLASISIRRFGSFSAGVSFLRVLPNAATRA